jgi:hypothetical protein
MAGGFGPDARLRARREFVAVEDGGRRVPGRYLILVGKPNDRAEDRLGIIASRRVGNAVAATAPSAGCAICFGVAYRWPARAPWTLSRSRAPISCVRRLPTFNRIFLPR